MEHSHKPVNSTKSQNEKKTAFVVLFSAATMVLEIIFGLFSKSMALLADGIHMGSHVLAIGLSWGAYILVRNLEKKDTHQVDTEKVLSLSAYTSGILLLVFALFILVEAAERFFSPAVEIRYTEAMIVAAIGNGGKHHLRFCVARRTRASGLQQTFGLSSCIGRCTNQLGSHIRPHLCHDMEYHLD